MPADFGWNLKVKLVEIARGSPILFFSANSGGVSGFAVHVALLRPGGAKTLESVLAPPIELSNQSQTVFWSEPDLSDSKVFVTANGLWAPGESHYGEHRYEISAYLWEELFYGLADRYITSRWYDSDPKSDVLGSERPEIIARLKKVIPGIRQRAQ